jgi:hypothetical protein
MRFSRIEFDQIKQSTLSVKPQAGALKREAVWGERKKGGAEAPP